MLRNFPLFGAMLFLIFSSEVAAQLPENRIAWEEQKLVWENFEGTPDPSSSFDANTNSGLSYSWSLKKDITGIYFIYEVDSYFVPQGSWVRPGKNSELLLAHEQLHFDITELFARQLRQKLKNFDAANTRNIRLELRKKYEQLEKERAQFQQKFDRETLHGQDETSQLRWRKLVDAALTDLKPFST